MYTLYTIPGSCSTGIAVLMKKLELNFTSVNRDDVSNYAEIVATNQVPALRTDEGHVITEGAAIALYLIEKHNEDVLPKDVAERADFYQWLNFVYATLHPAYAKIFAIAWNENVANDIKTLIMQDLADKLSPLWQILDKRLSTHKFILGDTPSHMDYMAAVFSAWNNYFPDTQITLGENVKRLVKDVEALPEFVSGFEADKAEFTPAA